MHQGTGASVSFSDQSSTPWSLWDYCSAIRSAASSMPNIMQAFHDWRNGIAADDYHEVSDDVDDDERRDSISSLPGIRPNLRTGRQSIIPHTSMALNTSSRSLPESRSTFYRYCKPDNITGAVFSAIAATSYLLNSYYSAEQDFDKIPTRVYFTSASTIVNGILFFYTGKSAYKSWSHLKASGLAVRAGLMAASTLPSFILLSSILRSTTEGSLALKSGASWTFAILMTILRDVLNAQTLEGLYTAKYPDARLNKIMVAISQNYERDGSKALILPSALSALALFYTFFEHARISEALDYMTQNNYSTHLDPSQQRFIEFLGCIPLACLNITWTLAGLTSNNGIRLFSLKWLDALAKGIFSHLDLILLSPILALTSRDTAPFRNAVDRSLQNLIDAWITVIVLSSGFAAVALAIKGSGASPNGTIYEWEATALAQIVASTIAYVIGVEMNFSSTELTRRGEDPRLFYQQPEVETLGSRDLEGLVGFRASPPAPMAEAIPIRPVGTSVPVHSAKQSGSASTLTAAAGSAEASHPHHQAAASFFTAGSMGSMGTENSEAKPQ
ncbi:MAG: hypothetical protein K0S29_574 [Gammaproteobacteria bacterium]|nr:hypothetical protein [Gammaproteobacteria bacterium]